MQLFTGSSRCEFVSLISASLLTENSRIKLLLMQTEHPATADTIRSIGLYALVLL